MKKNLLLFLALSAGSLSLWSQEPSYLPAQASSPKSSEQLPISKFMPEALNISGVECRLDKYVQPKQKMEEYVYDGNTVMCNKYDYDWTTNDWRYAAKSTAVYNQDEKLTLFEAYYCDPATNQWVGKVKYEYEYDANGHTILSCKYLWSESKNDWYCQVREESEFSPSGMKVSGAKWFGSETSSALKGGVKTENVLYESGSIKEKINYAWDEQLNDWTLSSKESLKYNSRGFTSESLISNWNPSTLAWEQTAGHRYVYAYNHARKPQTVKESVWDKDTDLWQEKYITTYGYDDNGCKIFRVRANALSEDPMNGFEKDVYEYNALNQVILHNAYVLSQTTQELWLSYKDEFTYDQYRNVSSFTRYKWLEGNPESFGWQRWEREYYDERVPALKAEYKWDALNKAWVGKSRQQLSKDEFGLDLDLAETYSWGPDGWLKSSYQAVEFDPENFMATVTEYASGSNQAIAQEYYYYRPIGTTGINDLFEMETPAFNIEGSCISTSDNGMITIYSIDGKLVNSSTGKVEAPTPGFYIIKVGDKASKVYVK